jgi:hypothetical protein
VTVPPRSDAGARLSRSQTGDGGRAVVHEHSSAPVDFDTGKVERQRKANP